MLDRSIAKTSKEILLILQESENQVKKIGNDRSLSISKQMMRDNIKIYLITSLKDFSKKVKLNQDDYMVKYKELVGDHTDYNEYMAKRSVHSSSTGDQSFLKEADPHNQELLQRGKEIDVLVNSISELGEVMNDFQALVFEQGTILDRIDHNIEIALDNTKKGHEELKKANENLKSNCARNASMMLLVIICIEIILIILTKFT